uniref:ClpB_D2-small domain-containing protein n=1 Tax=Caenorhabditis japonica TaxID=281687 RepID=A0A8R1DQK0_CAEJA
MDKRSLGFSSSSFGGSSTVLDGVHTTEKLRDSDEEVASKARDEMIKLCDQGDLISFGMIPELVGRFPVIVPFHSLNKSHLISVLTEPKGSLIAQTKKFFENENVELRFADKAIEEIAEMAVKRKTGARALNGKADRRVIHSKKISKKGPSQPTSFVLGEGFITGKTLFQNALTHQPPSGLAPIGRDEKRNEKMNMLYPKEIVQHLDKHVIGQAEAKKALAVAVYQHYKRVENNLRVTEQWLLAEAVSAAKERQKFKKANPDLGDDYLPEYVPKSQRQILKGVSKTEM